VIGDLGRTSGSERSADGGKVGSGQELHRLDVGTNDGVAKYLRGSWFRNLLQIPNVKTCRYTYAPWGEMATSSSSNESQKIKLIYFSTQLDSFMQIAPNLWCAISPGAGFLPRSDAKLFCSREPIPRQEGATWCAGSGSPTSFVGRAGRMGRRRRIEITPTRLSRLVRKQMRCQSN
jgi:hypothetical protein